MPCSNILTPYDGQQWLTFRHPHRKQSGQSCTNHISASNPIIVPCGFLQPSPRGNALWEIRKDLIHNGQGFSQEYMVNSFSVSLICFYSLFPSHCLRFLIPSFTLLQIPRKWSSTIFNDAVPSSIPFQFILSDLNQNALSPSISFGSSIQT